MIRNNKVFELKIEEDDELSGIDSISLVDEPAIEVNWIAFNKEKEHEFHIPDGEDDKYIEKLMSIAQDEQELFDEGWVVSKIEVVGKNHFISTDPNGPSEEDEEEYNVRYKYILNPSISQSAVIPTTRDFCRTLISKNLVWRIEDMERTRNDFGDSAMVWRGGFNCRHVWARIEYKKDATIINKASVNKGKVTVGGFPTDIIPDTRVLGIEQPSTVTSKTAANPSPSTVRNLGLSKEKYQEDCPVATQDVEVNLRNRQKAIVKAHYGPLNPNEPNEEYWVAKAKMFGGDVESAKKARCGNCAFFVQTKSMLDCISEGIGYDEDPELTIKAGELGYCEAFDFKCAAARTCDAWVVGGPIVDEDMGYDVGGLPSYVDQVSGKTIEKSVLFAEVGPKGGIKASPKAPKSDTPNKDPKGEGSAKGSASGKRGAVVSAENEKTLQNKVKEFNDKESNTKNGNATLGALKSVFQRGLGAFNTSHSPRVQSAEQWAFARVNAFLYLLKNGRPENPKYDTDYDLLPKGHPKAMSSQKFIDCKKCEHSWDLEDGGDDPYVCHLCGYDNSPSKDMFASYSDYPDSVKNNAKAVLKYTEENGWGSCGTPVGKQRANQLAKGEPISEDTIKRMYSYLSRHEVDLESSKGYGDGCGKLMYDSWGGKSALSWAESKIKSIERQKMSKQSFQTDDEKKIVLGPAMIPDLKIFRKDGMGNPYYVFFSAPTIKMIAEKYMRNKYLDNNDQMHDGKAVRDVYVFESWIKESENDKSTDYGYGDLPIGTWFVSMKVNNPVIWAKVKEGFLNGFSVSGYFEEVAQFCMEEMFLKQVAEILKNVKD